MKDMQSNFMDAYKRIRHVCEWLRSPKFARRYDQEYYPFWVLPQCMEEHSYKCALKIFEEFKDLKFHDNYKRIGMVLFETEDRGEILPSMWDKKDE